MGEVIEGGIAPILRAAHRVVSRLKRLDESGDAQALH